MGWATKGRTPSGGPGGRMESETPSADGRRPPRGLVRRSAAVLPVLCTALAVFLLRGGGVAHAQTSQVLVSNLGQTTQTAAGVVEGGTAQGFRTGTNAAGYTVTSIELLLDVGHGAFPPVALHSGSPAGSTVADFTVSSQSRTTGLTVYTYIPTTSVTLDGNTDYWVVVSYAAFGQLWGVAWIGEDVTPAPGWSIPYRGQYYHPDRGLEDYGDDLANQMRVNGTINSGGNGGGGGSSSKKSSSGGSSRAPSPPPALPRSPIIGSTPAATAVELAGDLLVLRRHDQPGVEVEVGIGWISRDGQRIIVLGFVRDGDLGQTYAVVRREGDSQVVRRWIAPDSPLRYAVPWALVNTQYTFPVGVIAAIPLDDQYPWPNQLARRFDGGDDRIFGYDAGLQQWRHVPDPATLQALGFYWCNVTAADVGFFERITEGPPYPASDVPARGDYPVCQT